MAVKGYLVFVPFGNVASMEYGNMGAPDMATVATTPGHLAGPFEVVDTVSDEPETPAPARTRRLKGCVERWPDCYTMGYDPRCCRFPKSCSADVYDEEFVSAEDLEA